MKNLNNLIDLIDQVLVKDRDSFLEQELVVLKDCKELCELICSTDDEEIKKVCLVELSLKLTVFFLNDKNNSLSKHLKQVTKSMF